MRVLLLFPHFNTLQQASSLRSWQIGRFLAEQGHDVFAFAPGVDMRTEQPFPEMKGKVYWHDLVDGVEVIRPWTIANFRRNPLHRLLFEFLFALMVFVRALFIPRVDVVVASYPPALLPPFGALLSLIRRIPLIYEVRDLMAQAVQSTGYIKTTLFARVALQAEALAARASAHIIAASPGVKKRLVERGIPANHITAIPQGYEARVFDNVDEQRDVRGEFGWGDRFVAVYAGAITRITDFGTLFAAAERLRDDHSDILFVIIGEGRQRREYMQLCEERALSNCQFLGYQERKHIPSILTQANVGVNLFPNDSVWGYMLGSKLFDYMGSGLPVVYSGEGDAADVIRHSEGGIVVAPEDVDGFAAAILWLYEHHNDAKAMGKRGQNYVRSEFDGDRLMAQYECLLTDIVKSRKGYQ